MSKLVETIERLNESVEEFTKDTGRKVAGLEQSTKDADRKAAGLEDRIERMEALSDRPNFAGGNAADIEHKALDSYLRTGDDKHFREFKSWTAGAVDGSNAVPEEISNQMLLQILQMSPLREHARILQASTGDFKFLVADDAQVASWGAEATTRSVTSTAYINSVTPTGGEQWVTIQASNWFVEDANFNVARFVIDEAVRQFAAAESEAFCTGSGSNRPTGLTNGATSSSDDQSSPLRAFGTFQHVASGDAATLGGDMLSSPQGDIVEILSNTVAAIRAGYLANAKWYMNPGTKANLIQKRDLHGRPIVESGLMGDPDRLLGYPIIVAEHLPAIGSNTLPIWFGDMFSGYTIVDRTGLRIIVDQVTNRGHTIWYISRRVYGAPADTAALKAVKIATS